MRRMILGTAMGVALVLGGTLLGHWHAQATPVSLDCWHVGSVAVPLPYGTVEAHGWRCYDAVFSPAGIAPVRRDEAALCDSQMLTDEPVSVRLHCDWYQSREAAAWDMFTSERYVYCDGMDTTYGFESRDKLGSSYLVCFTREVFLRALLG